jgi:hypothetical protein
MAMLAETKIGCCESLSDFVDYVTSLASKIETAMHYINIEGSMPP